MAQLTSLADGSTLLLPPVARFGRSRACDLQIPDTRVSALHAEVVWRGGAWVLHDCDSANGTYVEGARLQRRQYHPLRLGERFSFAQLAGGWQLTDDRGPRAFATNLQTGEQIEEDGEGRIVLPNPEGAASCVSYDLERGWLVEHDGVATRLGRDLLVARGPGWRITLPEVVGETTERAYRFDLSRIHLRLHVSRDRQRVTVELRQDEDFRLLEPSDAYVALWRLAEARLAAGVGGEGAWLATALLAERTGRTPRGADELLRRVRQDFEDAAISGASRLFDVRPGERRLAIGAERLKIVAS